MRPIALLPIALAWAVMLAPVGARAAGACVAHSGGETRAVADAAQRGLGDALRIDVTEPGQRAKLATRCDRVVVAIGPGALAAATALAPRTPAVTVMAGAPPRDGAAHVASDPDPRRVLETLRAVVPSARRVGAVYDADQTGPLVAEIQGAAQALGIELVALPVRGVGEAVRAFHRFETDLRVDAIWLLPDGTSTVQETVYYALELAHWRRIALIGLSRWYVANGALFALVPRPASLGAAAADAALQLLRGERPASPVRARDLELYLNQRTAAQLGLGIPRQLLEGAEQVLP